MGEKAPKLMVCGTGPMEEWCRRFSTENKINVEFKGFVPNAEVLKIIANSKALILPTKWYEGFPMSIVEAFSVGTPVICSDIGNTGSVVEDGINGKKFKKGNIGELIKTVNDQDVAVERVFQKYEEKYTENINYEKLRSIYMEIVI